MIAFIFFTKRVEQKNLNSNYFIRTIAQPSGLFEIPAGGIDGSSYWASEDVKGGLNGNVPAYLRMAPVTVTGATNLNVTLALPFTFPFRRQESGGSVYAIMLLSSAMTMPVHTRQNMDVLRVMSRLPGSWGFPFGMARPLLLFLPLQINQVNMTMKMSTPSSRLEILCGR